MTSAVINITREHPRIVVKAAERDPDHAVVIFGADMVFLSDHQAYELEARLANYRQARAAKRDRIRKAEDAAPIPAEAACGCTTDSDDLLESMASTYDVRREQAEYDARTGATNCPREVP